MIGGELQAEREELRHVVVTYRKQPGMFCGEDQRGRVAEVGEAEVSVGVHFAVEHGGNLSRLFGLAQAEGVACGDGLRQPQVEVFEESGRGLSVAVQLGEHERLEGVVDGGGDLCRDDAVALGVDDEDAGGGVEIAQVFGDAQLLGAAGEAVLGLHDGAVVGAGLQPLDVVVDGVAHGGAGRQRLEVLDGQALGAGDARVDVVALLEVDVLEEIAADGSGRRRSAKHLDTGDVRDRSFDGHQSLAQVFIDGRRGVVLRHGRVPRVTFDCSFRVAHPPFVAAWRECMGRALDGAGHTRRWKGNGTFAKERVCFHAEVEGRG